MSYFSSYFKKTVYSLCQIIGFTPPDTLQKEYSYLATHLQHPTYSIVYDYDNYLVEHMHKGLVELKEGKQWVNL